MLHDGPRLTAWVLGITIAFHPMYLLPFTHEFAEDLLAEDSLVEDITAVALLLGAVLGVYLADPGPPGRAGRCSSGASIWPWPPSCS